MLISEKDRSITSRIDYNIYWEDTRLVRINSQNVSSGSGVENEATKKSFTMKKEFVDKLFRPDMYIYSLLKDTLLEVYGDPMSYYIFQKDDLIRWYIESETTFSCKMDFSNYPFDKQKCFFRIGSTSFTMNKMVFNGTANHLVNKQRPLQYKVSSRVKKK